MKLYGRLLLVLCILHHNAWGTTAFFVQAPIAFKGHTLDAVRSGEIPVNVMERAFPRTPPPPVQDAIKNGARIANFPAETAAANSQLARIDSSMNEAWKTAGMENVRDIWDTLEPVKVQGKSLRTWSFESTSVERVQVLMKTEGRPLNASVELWEGPDNCPQSMSVYVEDGDLCPFSAVIETPTRSSDSAIAIRNTASLEFPFSACVEADTSDTGLGAVTRTLSEMGHARIVQGGSVHTYPFSPFVQSVQVLLETDGRPLNAKIELLQGPNNNKQVIELYSEDGLARPFFAVIEAPGIGNVVRIVNTATVEFPLTAYVEPYLVEPGTRVNELFSGPITGGNGDASERPPNSW